MKDFESRLAAAAVDRGLADAIFDRFDTPLGELLMVLSDRGVCRIAFAEEDDDRVLAEIAARIGARVIRSIDAAAAARDQLTAYLEGESPALDLPVDLALARSEFARTVLTTVATVPRGTVTTYSNLATRIGHPGAARATGTALGRNPVPVLVPCHRVVPASGGVGQYGGGPLRKELLLRLEGALQEPVGS